MILGSAIDPEEPVTACSLNVRLANGKLTFLFAQGTGTIGRVEVWRGSRRFNLSVATAVIHVKRDVKIRPGKSMSE